jgi:hypothetical protein
MQTAAVADKDEEASGGEERCPDVLPACRHPAKAADVKGWQQVMNGDGQENNTGATRVWTTNEIMPQRNNCAPGSLLALLLGLCTKLASLISRLPPFPLLPSPFLWKFCSCTLADLREVFDYSRLLSIKSALMSIVGGNNRSALFVNKK